MEKCERRLDNFAANSQLAEAQNVGRWTDFRERQLDRLHYLITKHQNFGVEWSSIEKKIGDKYEWRHPSPVSSHQRFFQQTPPTPVDRVHRRELAVGNAGKLLFFNQFFLKKLLYKITITYSVFLYKIRICFGLGSN
jgi:hypothetical protein